MQDNETDDRDRRGARGRREGLEFLVMVSLGLPGLALFVMGSRVLERSGGLTAASALLIGTGCFLVAACGVYYYARDYAHMGLRKGIAAFIAVTLLSGLAAVIATGTLGGILGGR